jgi:hypothetical protein
MSATMISMVERPILVDATGSGTGMIWRLAINCVAARREP